MGASSVLVAVQGERSDDEAVKLACELINSPKGKLHIVYVIEVERGFPVDAEIAPATAKGEEILKHMEEVAKSYKCKPEAELVQARQAGAAVVREAVEKDVRVCGHPAEVFSDHRQDQVVRHVLTGVHEILGLLAQSRPVPPGGSKEIPRRHVLRQDVGGEACCLRTLPYPRWPEEHNDHKPRSLYMKRWRPRIFTRPFFMNPS